MKRLNRPAWAWLLATLPSIALASPAAEAPIHVQGSGPFHRLTVPMSVVLAASDPYLADLRVFNNQGEAVPFSLIRETGQSRQALNHTELLPFPLKGEPGQPADTMMVQVSRNNEGTVIQVSPQAAPSRQAETVGYVLDASRIDAPLVRLNLDWDASQTGFQRVRIETSDDLRSWHPLNVAQLARLAYNGQQISQQTIELDHTRARYLRLLWESPQSAPRLDKVSLAYGDRTWQAAPTVWSGPLQASHDAKHGLVLTLPRPLQIDQLDIQLAQTNTLIPVQIAGRQEARQTWMPLVSDVVYRLQQQGGEWTHQQLQLPGTLVKYLSIQADERGGGFGQPLPTFRIGSTAHQLVFLAKGNGPYRLQVGQAGKQSISLPIDTLIPGWGTPRAPTITTASLGELHSSSGANLGQSVTLNDTSTPDWNKAALWVVLLLGVAVLGGMVWQLTRSRPKQ
ncbi:hypothetical protein HNQ59_003366 [Chitinivorax tropicus]|uniref:DUF3999 domain-containing protein n=1 Tax=Chitinivorax tropicus TaxID=714531 RepID=A0A840MUQ2_9PROT|nr:DUF3999 domain-containing protein [Chitinivorax tropicus]MBB5020053.1 hypothetical protein [Chitinivorax tropicus]